MSAGDYQLFHYQPALVKAFLIAGATRDIDKTNELIGDRDGAGAINYLNTQFNRGWAWWNGYNNSFFNTDEEISFAQEGFEKGKRYRIAISWLVDGDYVYANKRPNMDLNLYIKNGREIIASSSSSLNNFELVDFVAEKSSYDIVIDRASNSGTGDVLLGYTIGSVE